MSFQVVRQFPVKWPDEFTGVPMGFNPLESDQKTQRVFAEIIEEQRLEDLPLVIAYDHNSSKFFDARSLEEPLKDGNQISFFALFPKTEKLSFIGTNLNEQEKRVVELFLDVVHGKLVHQNLKSLSDAYASSSKRGIESNKAKQLMRMSDFHKIAEEERKMNDRVVKLPDLIYEEAVKLFQKSGEETKVFKKIAVISSRFYKPAYFPLFLCYHYEYGVKKNPALEGYWLDRALYYKDPRAIKWKNKADFSFTNFADDFKLSDSLHKEAKQILFMDWFRQPG